MDGREVRLILSLLRDKPRFDIEATLAQPSAHAARQVPALASLWQIGQQLARNRHRTSRITPHPTPPWRPPGITPGEHTDLLGVSQANTGAFTSRPFGITP